MLAPSPAGPGLHLFPVRIDHKPKAEPGKSPYDKKPTVSGWENCHRDDWPSDRWVNANAAGLACGKDVYLIDIDSYKPGSEAHQWLARMGLDKLPTRVHRSMTGGFHYWYKLPPGQEDLPTRTGVVPGLDTRGVGGYGVWTGEFDGKKYTVARDYEMAELPVTVCEELRRGAKAHKAKTTYRKIPHADLTPFEVRWADDLIAAHPVLGVALGAEWGDRSSGLLRCAGEALRAQISNVEDFGKLVWHSKGNARDHAVEKGWSRPLLRAWDTARGETQFPPLPDEDPLPGDGTGKKPLPPLVPRTFADIVANYQPDDYLIEDIIPSGAVTMLVSPPSWGKTAILMYMAHCVATGTRFGVHDVDRPGKVLYLVGEDNRGWHKRAIALWERLKLNPTSVVMEALTRQDVIDFTTGSRLDELLSSGSYVGVVVDTLASWFDGENESDNTQAQAFMRRLENWAESSGIGVIVAAHPTKDAKTGLARGASAFTGAAHTNLVLKGMERINDPVVAGVVKLHWDMKIRGDDFQPICFKLEKVVLATYRTPKGKAIKSVVAVPITEAEYDRYVLTTASAAGLTPEELLILRTIRNNPGSSQRARAKMCNTQHSTHVDSEKKLVAEGFLTAGYKLTDKGFAATNDTGGEDFGDISERDAFDPF